MECSNLKEHVSFLSFSTHRTKKPGLATDDKKKSLAQQWAKAA